MNHSPVDGLEDFDCRRIKYLQRLSGNSVEALTAQNIQDSKFGVERSSHLCIFRNGLFEFFNGFLQDLNSLKSLCITFAITLRPIPQCLQGLLCFVLSPSVFRLLGTIGVVLLTNELVRAQFHEVFGILYTLVQGLDVVFSRVSIRVFLRLAIEVSISIIETEIKTYKSTHLLINAGILRVE